MAEIVQRPYKPNGPMVRTIGEIAVVPNNEDSPAQVLLLTADQRVMVVPIGISHFKRAMIPLLPGTQFSVEVTAGETTLEEMQLREFRSVEQLTNIEG